MQTENIHWRPVSGLADQAKWDQFVTKYSTAPLFSSRAWSYFLAHEFGFTTHLFMAEKNGEAVGVFPLCLINNWTGRKVRSLPYSMYGGLAVKNPDELLPDLLHFAEIFSKEMRARFTHISTGISGSKELDGTQAIRLFPGEVDARIDLSHFDQVQYIESLHYKVRYEIRKALNQKIKIESGHQQRHVAEFHRLLCLFRRELGLPVASIQYFKRMLEKFSGEIFLAYRDDECVSASFTLSDEVQTYNVYNATHPKARNSSAGYLLYLAMMQAAASRGSQRLCLGGSPSNELLAYKKKWNPILQPTYVYSSQPFTDLKVKQKGIQLLRWLPCSILPTVSDLILRKAY